MFYEHVYVLSYLIAYDENFVPFVFSNKVEPYFDRNIVCRINS